jgi:hypothetical protein
MVFNLGQFKKWHRNSKEVQKIINEKIRWRVKSPEELKKLSESHKWKVFTEEHKKNLVRHVKVKKCYHR